MMKKSTNSLMRPRPSILSASDGKTYLRTFLINDERNNNGWRVSWGSIKKHAKSFIGRPGIEFKKCTKQGCMLDHTEGKSFQDSLHKQKKYKVSTIRKIEYDEPTHTAYAIHEIHDQKFADKVKKGEIQYLSPSIWPDKESMQIGVDDDMKLNIDTTSWRGIHDAFVDAPAYGPMAKIDKICADKSCMQQLSASQKNRILRISRQLHASFDESKHPRDEDGQFTEKGGGISVKGELERIKTKRPDLKLRLKGEQHEKIIQKTLDKLKDEAPIQEDWFSQVYNRWLDRYVNEERGDIPLVKVYDDSRLMSMVIKKHKDMLVDTEKPETIEERNKRMKPKVDRDSEGHKFASLTASLSARLNRVIKELKASYDHNGEKGKWIKSQDHDIFVPMGIRPEVATSRYFNTLEEITKGNKKRKKKYQEYAAWEKSNSLGKKAQQIEQDDMIKKKEREMMLSASFDESKHPRDEDGKFTDGGARARAREPTIYYTLRTTDGDVEYNSLPEAKRYQKAFGGEILFPTMFPRSFERRKKYVRKAKSFGAYKVSMDYTSINMAFHREISDEKVARIEKEMGLSLDSSGLLSSGRNKGSYTYQFNIADTGLTASFDESKHPRDEDGKFATSNTAKKIKQLETQLKRLGHGHIPYTTQKITSDYIARPVTERLISRLEDELRYYYKLADSEKNGGKPPKKPAVLNITKKLAKRAENYHMTDLLDLKEPDADEIKMLTYHLEKMEEDTEEIIDNAHKKLQNDDPYLGGLVPNRRYYKGLEGAEEFAQALKKLRGTKPSRDEVKQAYMQTAYPKRWTVIKGKFTESDVVKSLADNKNVNLNAYGTITFKDADSMQKFVKENEEWVQENYNHGTNHRLVPVSDWQENAEDITQQVEKIRKEREYEEDKQRREKEQKELTKRQKSESENYDKLDDSTRKLIVKMADLPASREEDGNGAFNAESVAKKISSQLRPPSGMTDGAFTQAILTRLNTADEGSDLSPLDKIRADKLKLLNLGSRHFYDSGDADRFIITAISEGMNPGQAYEVADDIHGSLNGRLVRIIQKLRQ